jgi:glycosyltransferase involved in cell wall biosynthesis
VKILYITYDGLLDPLGESQILPYIKGISSHQEAIVVLSFEKPGKMLHGQQSILSDINMYGILWKPLKFTRSFGSLGKLWDLIRMYFWSFYLVNKHGIHVVHARSHMSAQVAFLLKRTLKKKFIFDFRGLWVDERIDKGGWNLDRLSHRLQYKYFKAVERKLLNRADQIIVLTKKVVNEVVKLGSISSSKITIIPCCADFNHFFVSTINSKLKTRSTVGIPVNAFVVGYLGSVGNMYILDRLFYLFSLAANSRSDCHLMIITQNISEIEGLMHNHLNSNLHNRVHIKSASRDAVPVLLSVIDILVSFIRPSYARMASSPTKMAECFSAGIPVIANSGVGDVVSIIDKIGGGVIVDPFSDDSLCKIVEKLDIVSNMGGQRLRDAAKPLLGLDFANSCYKSIYDAL